MDPDSTGTEFQWIVPEVPDAPRRRSDGGPNWRALLAVVAAFTGLVAAYVLGQSAGQAETPAPAAAAPVAAETDRSPAAEADREALDRPSAIDRFLGPGQVIGELGLLDGSRVLVFCRNGTEVSALGAILAPTLALVHVAGSDLGEQLLAYEEVVKPQRRSNPCERCAPQSIELGGEPVLYGSCLYGSPQGATMAYVVARPTTASHTALALDLRCGITRLRVEGDRLVLDSEAPFSRNLMNERFPYPPVSFQRVDGRFVADDLELLDWNCDLGASTQLGDRHLLREQAAPAISYEPRDSAIGVIGVHGPLVLALESQQCEQLTAAFWNRPEPGQGSPIADLLGIGAPSRHPDWFYACNPGGQ